MNIDLNKIFNTSSELDKKFVDALLRAIKNNAIKEFDYLKFMHSVKSMQEMNMDVDTSYKSAFATAQTIGLTKEKLLKTANHYKIVLNKEREHFADALKNQRSEKISGKLEEVEILKNKILEYEEKMKQMNKEIAIYQKKIAGADSAIEKEKEKIETIKNNFVSSFEHFAEVLDHDIDSINNLL
ncbi:hypothetical protein [Portibacter lacus]|uniref:Uncharacterized protein n=1 Tax=Portibacter lacus TaxID=1099794 RepID=A0AA37WCH7_9BACT|nr:hypothetical protein [Portibacter lacus]GLR16063.1 hypothetical protein GCM10007940_06780 [Portibacter lacus]